MKLVFPVTYNRIMHIWQFPGLRGRWALYAMIPNLKRANRDEACYWLDSHKRFGWGTFNGACDPIDIGDAHTRVGAWLCAFRSIRQIQQGRR